MSQRNGDGFTGPAWIALADLGAAPQEPAPADAAAAEGLRESLKLLDLPEAWLLVLVILPLCALVAWIGYAREQRPLGARLGLAALRFGALVTLLVVLFRPVVVQRREEVQPAEVLLLVDDSASMRRSDAYAQGGSGAQAGDALARLAALAPRELQASSRLELARGAIDRVLLPHLTQHDYRPRLFAFGSSLAPIAETSVLTGRAAATHVGDAVGQALAAHRGRHVTDLIVVSDGRSNGGLDALEAARAAVAAGIPVHTLVVGDTRPERNAIVELVEAPSNALAGDEIAVIVRVYGRGTRGETTSVVLEEIHQDRYGGGRERQVRADDTVQLTESGERVLLVARPEEGSAQKTERRFRVSVPPLEGETLVDDNAIEFSVHVTPEKIRVLYVDGYPRWEYRYLKSMLLRADDNITAQVYLLSATPDFPQEATRGMPSLAEVPTNREVLLDNYDVIILGDVDPLAVSKDPVRGAEFAESLRAFVEAGGGLLMQAGESDNPESFVLSPSLQELLPVVLDPSHTLEFAGDTTVEVRPVLEDPTAPHEIVRLHSDSETNRRLWEDADGMRGFLWYQPVERAKPGAQVLARHPVTATSRTGERDPLIVIGYYPKGRTMFIAFDSTWRWRFHYGWRYHERFWRNSIRWLSLGRLKSGNRRVQLETPRSAYTLGERVTLEARVLDEDYRPSENETQVVLWEGPDGNSEQLELETEAERTGLYRGALEPDRPGLYRAWVEEDGSRQAATEFEVALPSRENDDPTPDPELLADLSRSSGGRALDLASVAALSAEFPGGEERREPISSKLDDVWDNLGTLALAVALLAAEWILRKRLEMV